MMKLRTYSVFASVVEVALGLYDGELIIVAKQDGDAQEVGTVVLGTPVPGSMVIEALIFTIAAHMYDAVKHTELNLNAQQMIRESMPLFDLSEQDYLEIVLEVWGENNTLPHVGNSRVVLSDTPPMSVSQALANIAKDSLGGTLPGY